MRQNIEEERAHRAAKCCTKTTCVAATNFAAIESRGDLNPSFSIVRNDG